MAYGVTEDEEARSSGRSSGILQPCGVYLHALLELLMPHDVGGVVKCIRNSGLDQCKIQYPNTCLLALDTIMARACRRPLLSGPLLSRQASPGIEVGEELRSKYSKSTHQCHSPSRLAII